MVPAGGRQPPHGIPPYLTMLPMYDHHRTTVKISYAILTCWPPATYTLAT